MFRPRPVRAGIFPTPNFDPQFEYAAPLGSRIQVVVCVYKDVGTNGPGLIVLIAIEPVRYFGY